MEEEEDEDEEDEEEAEDGPPAHKKQRHMSLDDEEAELAKTLPDIPTQGNDQYSQIKDAKDHQGTCEDADEDEDEEDDEEDEETPNRGEGNDSDPGDADVDDLVEPDGLCNKDGSFATNGVCFYFT